MSANAIPSPDSNIYEDKTEKRASERCPPLTLKQQFGRLLREVFEGHEEYLGATPD
jgi:hypothetical protein